jgi:YfiH family protein
MNIVRKGTTQVVQQNKHENEMEYLTFPSITATGIVSHAFSTRIGGASKGYFGEANYSFTRGDVREDVEENYRRMAQILGYGRSLEHFVTTFQTHTSNVRVITADDMGKGVIKERDYVDVDGMITNIPGIILTTFHADCPPIYFVDPVKRAIGLSHSGWKGTVSRIGRSTVEAMTREYGSNPSDIICAVGPSICVDCYEVSSDVADKFIDEFGIKDVPEYIPDGDSAGYIVYKKAGGKYQLNLWEAIRLTLIEAGVKTENIEITDICTHCNPDYLFSHRTAGEKRGNLAAFLVLN